LIDDRLARAGGSKGTRNQRERLQGQGGPRDDFGPDRWVGEGKFFLPAGAGPTEVPGGPRAFAHRPATESIPPQGDVFFSQGADMETK